MNLTMMVLNPDPLVHTIFTFFGVLLIMLVVLEFAGLVFLHQQESIPNLIFLRLVCSYQ